LAQSGSAHIEEPAYQTPKYSEISVGQGVGELGRPTKHALAVAVSSLLICTPKALVIRSFALGFRSIVLATGMLSNTRLFLAFHGHMKLHRLDKLQAASLGCESRAEVIFSGFKVGILL
jgi:hypothetical protein